MDSITLILALSSIIWLIVDRMKPLWADLVWGKYITTATAAVLGAIGVFGFELDLIYALGVVEEACVGGQLLTVLALMSGSSVISEIINRVKVE